MMKNKLLTGILSVSLVFSVAAPVYATSDKENDPHRLQLITRELVSQNNSLNRYRYVDESGNTVDVSKDSITTKKKRAVNLPASYDARDEHVITGIRDQGYTGCCWAFGAIKSLEGSAIRKGIDTVDTADYSENHVAWYTYNGVTDSSDPLYGDSSKRTSFESIYDQGGNPSDAIATLANWWGAAEEADAPFTADTEQEVAAMESFMSSADKNLRTKSEVHLTNANYYDDADINAKKQAIMENGAMSVSLYFDNNNVYQTDGDYAAYQNRYNGANYANHVVTIVGWDDNFSSFRTTPSQGKGAWLIANSYGTEWGNDGYYWVSYYDTSLCEFITYEAAQPDNYDTNYQYDGTGFESYLAGEQEDIMFSNIFTNTGSSPQKISAAAFQTLADGQKYQISVYRNLKTKNPTDGDYVASCTTQGTAERSGYHTVPLSGSIIVAPGESFSVVATFLHQNNTVYVPVEGSGSDHDSLKSFGSKQGQSFIYDDDTKSWIDTTQYPGGWGGRTTNLNNVCLKAFGTNVSQQEYDEQQANSGASTGTPSTSAPSTNTPSTEPPATTTPSTETPATTTPSTETPGTSTPGTKITVKNSKITIGKGEKVKLSYTVSPTGQANTLSFKSSNSSVASVSSGGVITGKKTGTAKITVSSSSGGTTSASVTVKKAPSSVKVKAGKSTLKKGKTTSLKVTLPKNSASYKITYQSSNKKIAAVNSKGVVTAKKKGTVKIKVKTFNGKTKTIKIKVK